MTELKNYIFVSVAFLGCCVSPVFGQTWVDFEDIGSGLAAESFYNGSDDAGGFQSGSLFFNNSYSPDQGFGEFWSGWSYSNRTDTATPGFGNQYSSIFGLGDSGSATYAVAFGGSAEITSTSGRAISSFSITNTTYAALSMRDGDAFSKEFGGPTGNDPDFFKVDILALDAAGQETGSIEFFLADFRFADNSQDYILDQWATVDVSSLNAKRLGFRFDGSDIGMFGLNTPTYFAVDNILVAVPEPSAISVVSALGLLIAGLRRRRVWPAGPGSIVGRAQRIRVY